MTFFDCNCSFGDPRRPPFRHARQVGELLEQMRFCGIERALVRHTNMRFGSPVVWNRELLAAVKGYPNLEPTWAILPSQTGEQPRAKEFVRLMQAHGVRALWAFPSEHRYRLDGRTFGELMEALSERRVPLFIKANLVVIGDLLKEFPKLTAVAANQGPASLERYLRPLMETYPNLHAETSYYLVERLIEESCELYGPHRLLFGSGFPDNCSGGALLRLAHAEIDDSAKAAIASGNLERLLGEAQV